MLLRMLLLACWGVAGLLSLQAQTVSRYAHEDAIALEAYPDSVFDQSSVNGNILAYKASHDGALKAVYAYVKFDLSGLQGGQVSAASLSYRGKTGEADFEDEFALELFSLKADFDASALTWGNKPGSDKKLATSVLNSSSARKEFINDGSRLVDYLNEAARSGKQSIGFLIRSAGKDSTSNMWIGGADNGNYAPILSYTITPAKSGYPMADAIVLEAYPDSIMDQGAVNGNILAYRTPVEGALKRVQSYLKFDISHLQGQQLESVGLSYRGKTGEAAFEDEFGLELFSLKADFDADALSWGTRPARDRKLATSLLNSSSARKAFINDGTRLVDYFNEEIRKGATTIGLLIRSSGKDSTSNMWIGGAANGSYAPVLDYTLAPAGSHYGTADAIVLEAYPDSVMDQSAVNGNLLAYRTSMEGEWKRVQSYVKFDLSGLQGQQLEAASFSYRGKTGEADFEDEFGLELFSLKADFDADALSWGTRPARDKKLATSLLNSSSARKAFINDGTRLVDYLNEAIRTGAPTVGFMIRSAGRDSTSNMWLGGVANGNYGPVLDYTLAAAQSSYGLGDAIVLQAFPDSVVDQAAANGNLLAYRESVDGSLQRVQSLISFDISGLKTEIENAEFSYRGRTGEADFEGLFELELFGLKARFDPENTTWNNQPGRDKKIGTSALTGSSARKAFINDGSRMADFINEALRNGEPSVSFLIRSAGKDSTSNMWIGGIANGNYGPQLDITVPNLFKLENDTLDVVEDVYISQADPDANFESTEADMHVILDETNAASKEIYLKFDISEAKNGIGTATLMLRGDQKDPPSQDENFFIELHGTDSDEWTEGSLTWNTQLTTTGSLATYNITESAVHPVSSVDLTAYVNSAIEAGRMSLTFVVKGRDETSFRAWISSKDWVGARLALDYSTQEKVVTEDSYVAETSPDENYDGVTAMEVARDEAGANDRETYLKFNVADARSNIVTGTLILKADQQRQATVLDEFFIQVYGVNDNGWDETTLTWNNKPAVGEMLMEYNVTESADHALSSPALTDYIKQAITNGHDDVSFVVKGRDDTPGSFVWISDKGWRPAKLFLDYRKIAAPPVFLTPEGDYVPEVTVELASQTPGASIYYTLDGSEPTEASMLYDGGILLTDTTTIKALAIGEGLAASEVVEATYNVAPVGVPEFDPNPAVEYSDAVTVTIALEPEGAFIFFSDDGTDPLTPYPAEGILLTETTTLRARGVSADGAFLGPIAEATYTIVNTVPGTGTGPAGVGAPDNTIAGQPENPLWLRADAIEAADGEDVSVWEDLSGNDNHAYNTYSESGGNGIPNTGESQKPAPTFRANALNGRPVLDFGQPADGDTRSRRSLIIDDADNLDGGAGISIFVVFKRNELFADFAAVFQKRDITAGAAAQSYVLEFNGGADPNTMQFVIERQLFLRNGSTFDAENFYVVNAELQGDFETAIFRKNGEIERIGSYRNIMPAVAAPVILGGFQPMDIAEVIMYKKGLNAAQNRIVHNYLAVKYGLDITDGESSLNLYTNEDYTEDLIGVGKELYLDESTEQEHTSASGAGLQMDVRGSLGVGDYVLAAHNGAVVSDPENWSRHWYIQTTGNNPNVNLAFDFEALELEVPQGIDMLKLFFNNGSGWTDLGLTPVRDGQKVVFEVNGILEGAYAMSTQEPGSVSIGHMDVSSQLKLYPNPLEADQLTLEFETGYQGPIRLRVYDNLGRISMEMQTRKHALTLSRRLDTRAMKAGLYMVEIVQQDGQRAIRKFIKK